MWYVSFAKQTLDMMMCVECSASQTLNLSAQNTSCIKGAMTDEARVWWVLFLCCMLCRTMWHWFRLLWCLYTACAVWGPWNLETVSGNQGKAIMKLRCGSALANSSLHPVGSCPKCWGGPNEWHCQLEKKRLLRLGGLKTLMGIGTMHLGVHC